MSKNTRDPKGGIIIFPPIIGPITPGGKPQFPPILPLPPVKPGDKKTIKIKSVSEDEFVIVAKDGYLYATGEKVNKNGIFQLIMLADGKVRIRQDGGSYVRLDKNNVLIADADKEDAIVFKLYKMDNKQYVLYAPNGYYVKVRDKDKALVAKAEDTGPKTLLKFKEVEDY